MDEAARAALRAKNPEGQTVAALAATLRAPADEVRAVSTPSAASSPGLQFPPASSSIDCIS